MARGWGRWWVQAIGAGLVGALAMALVLGTGTYWNGNGFWTPLNATAGAFPIFRPLVLTFDWPRTTLGLGLHLLTSVAWALAAAAIATRLLPRALRSYAGAALLGLGWGLVVYALMGLVIGPLISPLVLLADPLYYFFSHLAYGLGTLLALRALAGRQEIVVTFVPEVPLAERREAPRR